MSTGKIGPGVLCVIVNTLPPNLGRLVEVLHPAESIQAAWWVKSLGSPLQTENNGLQSKAVARARQLRPIDGLTDDEIAHIKAGEPMPAQRVEGDKVPA